MEEKMQEKMEKKRYYSVDRLEGGLAVLVGDDDAPLTLPVEALAGGEEQLPAEAPASEEVASAPDAPIAGKRSIKEGDILVRQNGCWLRDDAEAARRRKKNAVLLASLRRRNAPK